jgi:hypothetical protein
VKRPLYNTNIRKLKRKIREMKNRIGQNKKKIKEWEGQLELELNRYTSFRLMRMDAWKRKMKGNGMSTTQKKE